MRFPQRTHRFLFALGLTVGGFLPATAHADELFSSLPYSKLAVAISGPTGGKGGYSELAAQFTVSQTAFLDSIDIPLAHFAGAYNDLTITLFSSVNNTPGIVLASKTLTGGPTNDVANLYNFNFGGSPLLTAGTSYFVDAKTTGNTFDGWFLSNLKSGPLSLSRSDPNGTFRDFGIPLAFRVNGSLASVSVTAVPEPAFYAMSSLLALGGGGLLLRHRRARAY